MDFDVPLVSDCCPLPLANPWLPDGGMTEPLLKDALLKSEAAADNPYGMVDMVESLDPDPDMLMEFVSTLLMDKLC